MKQIKKDDRISVCIDVKNNIVFKNCCHAESWRAQRLQKEYDNLKKIHRLKLNSNIIFPQALGFSKIKRELKMRYVHGRNLKDILDPGIYEAFGKELKKLHKTGITHGHLELQDVLYSNKKFCLVDLARLNEVGPLRDYARFKLSIHFHQMKNILNWSKYNKCSRAFTKGYCPDKETSQKYLDSELIKIVNRYFKKKGALRTIKGLIIRIALKNKIKKYRR
ncbi:hypothetical protein KY346_02020 [Candidatus Woesearchaeota archaeon]|nr:hypothetical protein [Candidatus Woesearchaeota archaeon]